MASEVVNTGSAEATRVRRAAPVLLLLGLYVTAVVVYVLLGRRQPVPLTSPDEFTYGHLAQSVADGDGLTWRGATGATRAALYVYAIAPAWLLASLADAYAMAKAIGAGLLCLAIFPTYLLARRYTGPFLALVPAALTVAGTWMISSAGIVTENLAFPLATAALAAAVAAIAAPGSRWGWVAIGLSALAAGARLQLAVLVPIILCAVLIDAARQGRGWKDRLRAHRVLAITTGVMTVAGLLFALTSKTAALGSYAGIQTTPPLGEVASGLWRESIALLMLAGFAPLFVAAAASLRRATWRDSDLGPLLAVLWAAVALTVVESAWVMHSFPQKVDYQIERYVQYVLPLLFVFMVVALDRKVVRARLLVIAVAIGVVAVAPVGAVKNRGEERAQLGIEHRVNEVLGTSPGMSVALAALLVGGILLLALVLARRDRSRTSTVLIATAIAVIAGVFAVQQQLGWSFQVDVARAWRAAYPGDLEWIDHTARAPVARFVVISNSGRSEVTEFFNSRITQVYVPDGPVVGHPIHGRHCVWTASESGAVAFEQGCEPQPTRLLLNDDWGKATFYDQRVLRDATGVGRIVEIPPPGRPRLRAILYVPCGPPIIDVDPAKALVTRPVPHCIGSDAVGRFWLDAPATLVLRFRGGATPQRLAAPDQSVHRIPPRTITTLRFPVAAGQSDLALTLGWTGPPPDAPALVGARLQSATSTVDLLY